MLTLLERRSLLLPCCDDPGSSRGGMKRGPCAVPGKERPKRLAECRRKGFLPVRVVSAGMQNVQRAGEHSGRGGRKEKPAEDRPEAPRPKKMKLGSASGAASGGAW